MHVSAYARACVGGVVIYAITEFVNTEDEISRKKEQNSAMKRIHKVKSFPIISALALAAAVEISIIIIVVIITIVAVFYHYCNSCTNLGRDQCQFLNVNRRRIIRKMQNLNAEE